MCETKNQPKIDLELKKYYSVNDVLKIAVDLFRNEQTKSLFDNSRHEIGLNDNMLKEFIVDGIPVGLWDWIKTRVSGQIRLCLCTTGLELKKNQI